MTKSYIFSVLHDAADMDTRGLANKSQFNPMQVQYLLVDIVALFSRTTDLFRKTNKSVYFGTTSLKAIRVHKTFRASPKS